MNTKSKFKKIVAVFLVSLIFVLSINISVMSAYSYTLSNYINVSDDAHVTVNGQVIETGNTNNMQEPQTQYNIDTQIDISNFDVFLREENFTKQYSTDDIEWITYEDSISITGDTTYNSITVYSGEHNIVLNNVKIDVSNTDNMCALKIQGTSKVVLILEENTSNILKSGYQEAGISVGESANLEVTGSGSLEAFGGGYSAGIGGGRSDDVGNITIKGSAQIVATGGDNGTGIGGGYYGYAKNITIEENANVVAQAYGTASGVGSAYRGEVQNITISGGATVVATGGNDGAGIGSASGSSFNQITITDNAKVTATGKEGGAGIGGKADIGITLSKNADVTAMADTGSAIGASDMMANVALTIGNGVKIKAVNNCQTNNIYSKFPIQDDDNAIETPIGEQVANILLITYSQPQIANTETIVNDSANEMSIIPTAEHNMAAFSGLEVGIPYSVIVDDNALQYEKNGTMTTEYILQTGLNNFLNNSVAYKVNLLLDIAEGSLIFTQSDDGKKYVKQGIDGTATQYQSATIQGTTTENTVIVESGTHNITLNNLNIDVSPVIYACAFNIQGESIVNLKIAKNSTNTLKSGETKAGIQVQSDETNTATLTITGEDATGILTSTSELGAGIGGGYNATAGNITISGDAQVIATGNGGAGIGGGVGGNGGNITISENAQVEAFNSSNGSGIGGGVGGSGVNITISGNAQVEATGGYNSAGIGGGDGGDSGIITISGNAQVEATSGTQGAGVGSGLSGNVETITISENAQVTAIGVSGTAIGNGLAGNGGTITISENAQVTALGEEGGVAIANNPLDVDENATILSIGEDAKVILASEREDRTINVKGDITAPQGETATNVMKVSFDVFIPSETKINLMQNGEVLYSYTTVIDGVSQIAFAGVKASANYQVEIQYQDETTPTIKQVVIEGETQEKETFNISDKQITNVKIVEDVAQVYFMITNAMKLDEWRYYKNYIEAVTDSGAILSLNNGLEVVELSKEELKAFGKNYELDGVLIKASVVSNVDTIKFYIKHKEDNPQANTPEMVLNNVKEKVIYIGDFESYNSQTVDQNTLIKNLTYNVTIDYPNSDGVNGQNLITDTVYIGTDVRQFATTQSRYKDYSFKALDGESTSLDRDITLTATDEDKTYNLSLPFELLESEYPNLYSNATSKALADTLIYAISVDGKTGVYEVYNNTYIGFENQYTANMTYGKTVWLKAPLTVENGEFVGWYNIDEQVFVSYKNEYKFIMTQNTKLVPIYSDNTQVTVSEKPYALSENTLYETYVTSDGVAKIRYVTPLTYFPQNVDNASYKVRYQVALNDEAYDLNGVWVEKDLTQYVNDQNRVNYSLVTDYYNLDGGYNTMTIYVQPYVEYESVNGTVDTKLNENAIATIKYEYPFSNS